jgi:hypothetical protein
MSLRQMKRNFSTRLDSIERTVVQDLAMLTHHVATFNGTMTENGSSQVDKMVHDRTSKLMNVKILRMNPISFN